MIIALLTLLHVLVCFILIVTVLLQSGKGADLAGAFGGGGSQTAFGSRGPANFLSRLTSVSAITFMVTSLALALFFNQGASSSNSAVPADDPKPATSAPAVPGVTVPVAPPVTTPSQEKSEVPASNSPAKPDQKAPENPPKP